MASQRQDNERGAKMDQITKALVEDFSKSNSLGAFKETQRFELYSAYCVLLDAIDGIEDVTAPHLDADDYGIDSLAIVVNGKLVQSIDEVDDLLANNKYLDVDFHFVQSKTSTSVVVGQVLTFLSGVQLFFADKPSPAFSEKLRELYNIKQHIFGLAAQFRNRNPCVSMYFCYCGSGDQDPALSAATSAPTETLKATSLFSNVDFKLVGARGLQKLYNKSKAAIAADIEFQQAIALKEIEGVTESYLGALQAKEYLKLVTDDDGHLVRSIFYDNIRDFDSKSKVNEGIADTIKSPQSPEFVLRNNGVTIVARQLSKTGNKFSLRDYQVVNGCQTSHVLFHNSASLTADVYVPIKIIATDNEDVVSRIILSTNRQNEVRREQLWALEEFHKIIEQYFQTMQNDNVLFYERRTNQFAADSAVERVRIITPSQLAKAVAAVYLDEGHRSQRYYQDIVAMVEANRIFGADHKPEPYYAAAYIAYRLEWMFRTKRLDTKYKVFRYHLLMAFRYRCSTEAMPALNSKHVAGRSASLVTAAGDQNTFTKHFEAAAKIADKVVADTKGYGFNSDTARQQAFRDAVRAAAQST